MPQHGLHALIGAAVGRRAFAGHVPVVLGFVVGSIIPDFDILAMAVMRLAGAGSEGVHRTLTHSILFAGCLLVVGGLGWPRWRVFGGFMVGAGLGVLGHIGLDVLLWFSGVDLLWPLSGMKGWGEVNLWRGVRLPAVAGRPDLIQNQLTALNLLVFALYFAYLGRIARQAGAEARGGTPAPVTVGERRAGKFVRALALACWALFPLYVVTGVFLNWGQQTEVVYPLVVAVLLPAAFIAPIVLRRPLAGVR